MARRRPVHDALVQAAMKRQRSAGAKISRLRRNGVDPTTIDPRQSAAQVRAMSNDQLRKYTDRLDSFVRNRGYVAGVNGAPINRTAFEYLKRLERQNNKVAEITEAMIGTIKVPTLGEQTIASQIERRNREKFTAGGEQVTFQTMNRKASDITGQASIMKLISGMQKKLAPDYLANRMQVTRANIVQMLDRIGVREFSDQIYNISDNALNTMVDYSPFMKSLSARYEYMKAMDADEEYKPENWMQDVFDTSLDEVKDFLTWGQALTNGDTSEYTDTTAKPIPVIGPDGKPRKSRGKPGKRK